MEISLASSLFLNSFKGDRLKVDHIVMSSASYSGDLKSTFDCMADLFLDVYFNGAMWLNTRLTEVVLCDDSVSEAHVDFKLKVDVMAIFLVVHTDEAYEIMRSLDIDYVLVMFGGVTGYSCDDINNFLWIFVVASCNCVLQLIRCKLQYRS